MQRECVKVALLPSGEASTRRGRTASGHTGPRR